MTKKNSKKIDNRPEAKIVVNPLEPTQARPEEIVKIDSAIIAELNGFKGKIDDSALDIRLAIVNAGKKLKHIKIVVCGNDNIKFHDALNWYREFGHLEISKWDIGRFIYIANNYDKAVWVNPKDKEDKTIVEGLGIEAWLIAGGWKDTTSVQKMSKGHTAFIQWLIDWNDPNYVAPKKEKAEEKSLSTDKRTVSRLIADVNQFMEKIKSQVENAGSVINKKDTGILMGVQSDIDDLI